MNKIFKDGIIWITIMHSKIETNRITKIWENKIKDGEHGVKNQIFNFLELSRITIPQ